MNHSATDVHSVFGIAVLLQCLFLRPTLSPIPTLMQSGYGKKPLTNRKIEAKIKQNPN